MKHNTILKRMIDEKKIDMQSMCKPYKYYRETTCLTSVKCSNWNYQWKPMGSLRLS